MSIQLFIDKWLSKFEQSHFEWLLTVSVLVTLAWIVLSVFVYWRRATTNLTPVDLPAANRNATPDFLSVDYEKRNKALQSGDHYAAQRNEVARSQRILRFKKVFGWLAFVLAIAALAIVFAGSIWPDSYAGSWLSQYSEHNRAIEILTQNPIAILAAVAVVTVRLIVSVFMKVTLSVA